MKDYPFRQFHLFALLEMMNENQPLDRTIHHYFRAHSALGSKDRRFLAETIYGMVRWQGLIDYLSGHSTSYSKRYEVFEHLNLLKHQSNAAIPEHIRVSFPQELYEKLVAFYGQSKAFELCLTSNTVAPLTIRANPLKTNRDELLSLLQKDYQVSACQESELGITFHEKLNFFSHPLFKDGMFEVQDEGSQLIAKLMEIKPGQQVMDYCSGSGGKTLAFAHLLNKTGQIYMHDIRPHILIECRKRFKRAGIQNAQFIKSDDAHLKKLKKRMDVVLVDVPCSGTGTYRRNPDMKWKWSQDMMRRLVGEQRHIFEKALSFVKPNGMIVYATCSMLPEENQEQVQHFLKTYSLKLKNEPYQCLPEKGSKDGFFGAVFTT